MKNETDATFLDVYDVFASKFCPFPHLSSEMKVNHAFKAKKEAFRERISSKVKKGPFFDHLTLRNPDRDENNFFDVIFSKPSAKFEFKRPLSRTANS